MHVEEAQDLNRGLQIDIMRKIRNYEKLTGLRITKASMQSFEDTRFFTTTIFMPPKTRKADDR